MSVTTGAVRTHRMAMLFPLMDDAELQELADDIRDNGLFEPLTMCEGQLLDGRNRLRACEIAGVEPRYETYSGADPLAYVISKNLRRRHLSSAQRATFAVDVLPLLEERALERKAAAGRSSSPGRPVEKDAEKVPHLSLGVKKNEAREEAASLFGTNSNYVQQAKRIQKEAPETFEELRAGKVTMRQAMQQVGPSTQRPAEPKPRVEKPVTGAVDPRIADTEAALKLLERCIRGERDVYRIAFINIAASLRGVLKHMHADDRIAS